MKENKTIALVAHDNRKKDLAEWVAYNSKTLMKHRLIGTGTTAKLMEEVLLQRATEEDDEIQVVNRVTRLKSGPLGGDQQLGAMIAEDKIDILIFLWDPMEPQPHDVDVKALLRIAAVYNIPVACNRSTADFIISSPLLEKSYERQLKDYTVYLNRPVV